MAATVDFIFFKANQAEGNETRRRIRSRAAQHSHRSGLRKPMHSQSSSQSSRRNSIDAADQIALPASRPKNILRAPTANNAEMSYWLHRVAEHATPALPASQQSHYVPEPASIQTDSTDDEKLEFAHILNSARIGYAHQLPVPEELPWYPALLDYSKFSDVC